MSLPLPLADADAPRQLTSRQKAALLVHVLMSGGAELSLQDLPESLQADLVREIGAMGPVDMDTVDLVVAEFGRALTRRGIGAAGGLPGALRLLETSISPSLARRLRAQSGPAGDGDAWLRIGEKPNDGLLPALERESVEVAAVILSKLPVPKAAEPLGLLPGDRARRLTYAISQIGAVRPEAVDRIGRALATELEIEPVSAFSSGPVERVGAILNFSRAATRNDVLAGLDETDAEFAESVRRAIFTFANIPERIDPRDVPRILRRIDQPVLIRAFAGARDELTPAAEFLLDNVSKRMAESLRGEVEDLGDIGTDDAEEAMSAIVSTICAMEEAGEIYLIAMEA